jgi:CelD/BcsL family acetyltransferase involved in cellulose biosynthesis
MSSVGTPPGLAVTVIDDFEHAALDGQVWDRLLALGETDVVFLTLGWQREWWRAYGGDRLMLVVAEEHGEPQAIAPLFALEGMLFFVGSGESDYLDFIGEPDEPTLAAMLDAARRQVPDFHGIALSQVPTESRTTSLLPGIAMRLGLELHLESDIGAPYLDLSDAQAVSAVVDRRRLRSEENRMAREAPLRIRTATDEDLDPWLECFFMQHTNRWRDEGDAQFTDERHRTFCQRIVHTGHRAGWVRFSMLEWKGGPAAFDITLVHRDRHLALLVSRDTSISRYSPPRILQNHVIKSALAAGARRYDFGLGEEPHKLAHASALPRVASWQLWPK